MHILPPPHPIPQGCTGCRSPPPLSPKGSKVSGEMLPGALPITPLLCLCPFVWGWAKLSPPTSAHPQRWGWGGGGSGCIHGCSMAEGGGSLSTHPAAHPHPPPPSFPFPNIALLIVRASSGTAGAGACRLAVHRAWHNSSVGTGHLLRTCRHRRTLGRSGAWGWPAPLPPSPPKKAFFGGPLCHLSAGSRLGSGG